MNKRLFATTQCTECKQEFRLVTSAKVPIHAHNFDSELMEL